MVSSTGPSRLRRVGASGCVAHGDTDEGTLDHLEVVEGCSPPPPECPPRSPSEASTVRRPAALEHASSDDLGVVGPRDGAVELGLQARQDGRQAHLVAGRRHEGHLRRRRPRSHKAGDPARRAAHDLRLVSGEWIIELPVRQPHALYEDAHSPLRRASSVTRRAACNASRPCMVQQGEAPACVPADDGSLASDEGLAHDLEPLLDRVDGGRIPRCREDDVDTALAQAMYGCCHPARHLVAGIRGAYRPRRSRRCEIRCARWS